MESRARNLIIIHSHGCSLSQSGDKLQLAPNLWVFYQSPDSDVCYMDNGNISMAVMTNPLFGFQNHPYVNRIQKSNPQSTPNLTNVFAEQALPSFLINDMYFEPDEKKYNILQPRRVTNGAELIAFDNRGESISEYVPINPGDRLTTIIPHVLNLLHEKGGNSYAMTWIFIYACRKPCGEGASMPPMLYPLGNMDSPIRQHDWERNYYEATNPGSHSHVSDNPVVDQYQPEDLVRINSDDWEDIISNLESDNGDVSGVDSDNIDFDNMDWNNL